MARSPAENRNTQVTYTDFVRKKPVSNLEVDTPAFQENRAE